jgi:hypothetical protein
MDIDWTHEAATDDEKALREVFLATAVSADAAGLIDTLILAAETRRAGPVAGDLVAAEEYATALLRDIIGDRRGRWLASARDLVASKGSPFA